MMHSEQYYSARYTPTSPLSSRMSSAEGHYSPPSTSRSRVGASQLASRRFHMELPAYTLNFGDRGASVASPTARVQSPAINLHRGPQPTPMESAHSLRKGQRELLRQHKLSSQLAASPAACRPDAPRLDPLGSPKDAVTPLALEEANDYFAVASSGRFSPAGSPGGRSSRNDGAEQDKKKTTST